MANRKKIRSQKKKVVSFSIKTGIAEEFRDICDAKRKVPSHIVEELISTFNKDYLNE